MTVTELIVSFLGNRLIRTGYAKRTEVVTQEDFDRAYVADIEGIVERYLKWRELQ